MESKVEVFSEIIGFTKTLIDDGYHPLLETKTKRYPKDVVGEAYKFWVQLDGGFPFEDVCSYVAATEMKCEDYDTVLPAESISYPAGPYHIQLKASQDLSTLGSTKTTDPHICPDDQEWLEIMASLDDATKDRYSAFETALSTMSPNSFHGSIESLVSTSSASSLRQEMKQDWRNLMISLDEATNDRHSSASSGYSSE